MSRIILILEDEQVLVDAIKMKLERNGFSALTAPSVKQGLVHLNEAPKVDAIWLDHYLLGVENGLDFVQELKKNPAWMNIPIFVVSNTASPDKIQAYGKLGVNKYYTKANSRLEQIIDDIKALLN